MLMRGTLATTFKKFSRNKDAIQTLVGTNTNTNTPNSHLQDQSHPFFLCELERSSTRSFTPVIKMTNMLIPPSNGKKKSLECLPEEPSVGTPPLDRAFSA